MNENTSADDVANLPSLRSSLIRWLPNTTTRRTVLLTSISLTAIWTVSFEFLPLASELAIEWLASSEKATSLVGQITISLLLLLLCSLICLVSVIRELKKKTEQIRLLKIELGHERTISTMNEFEIVRRYIDGQPLNPPHPLDGWRDHDF